jgi:hypothetical protein
LAWRGGISGYNFGNPAFVFNDLTMAGDSFPDTSTHIAAVITGNKTVTSGVPSGTGSYTSLFAEQYCQGMSATGYCTGALLQSVAVYNPNSAQNAGNYTGNNPQVQIPATTGCPTCGPLGVNSAVGEEIDLFLNQAVSLKEGLTRIIHDSTSFSSPRRARAPSTSPDLIRIGV